jgi:hypothetical protein
MLLRPPRRQEFEIVSLAAGHRVTITIPPPGLWLCAVTVAAWRAHRA